ncbi:helix-turn-helix domain-containing protein [Acidaminobacter sp. JC074]|uniref:AraC family transcriptional regulator n=1 Tax=Acidaminobacter sp. JC074 TaxID=2530199 RepID=UPI001F108E74|nr:AraC family transcriptional regulator [Acidaminobacter sp. JC074]MCH4889544.1 helix-turn-helix domain-containing protein [Acidaminobacter sp. JC074]
MGKMTVLNDEMIHVNDERDLHFEVHHLEGKRTISEVQHVHYNLEVSYVKAGRGRYYIGDKVYNFKKGDIFVINNREEHGIELDDGVTMENLVVHFVPRFIWSDSDDFNDRYLKIFFERPENFSHQISGSDVLVENMRHIFAELEEEFKEKRAEYKLMAKVKLLNILVLMLRHYDYPQKDYHLNSNRQEARIINDIIDFIDINYHKNIKLSDMADIAHMNSTYFSSFFKKYNGISPIEYLVRKRITSAKVLLKNTNKTILDIAGSCGFNTSANFNKMFKKVTDMTPSEYRKSFRDLK